MRTRERIRQAALDLFEDRGVDAVTVDDIAAAAEVSRRSFFHHFPTKEDAALLPLDRGGRMLADAAASAPRRPAFMDTVIDLTLHALRSLAVSTPEATSLAWRSARLAGRDDRLHQRVAELMVVWEQTIDDALADEAVSDDPITRRVTIASVVAATRVALLWAAANGQPKDLIPTVEADLDSLRGTGGRPRRRGG